MEDLADFADLIKTREFQALLPLLTLCVLLIGEFRHLKSLFCPLKQSVFLNSSLLCKQLCGGCSLEDREATLCSSLVPQAREKQPSSTRQAWYFPFLASC